MMKNYRFFLWFTVFAYVFFIYSSLFYGKDIARHIYKSLGYYHYSIFISLICLIGLILIFINTKRNYTFFEVLFIGLGAFINGLSYFLTSFPTDRLHLIEYMILGILIYKAINLENIRNDKLKIVISFLILFAIAIEDEILQSYMPNRDAEIEDIIRDLIGGLYGIYISYINGRNLLNTDSSIIHK